MPRMVSAHLAEPMAAPLDGPRPDRHFPTESEYRIALWQSSWGAKAMFTTDELAFLKSQGLGLDDVMMEEIRAQRSGKLACARLVKHWF
jgi:hypothetical protein